MHAVMGPAHRAMDGAGKGVMPFRQFRTGGERHPAHSGPPIDEQMHVAGLVTAEEFSRLARAYAGRRIRGWALLLPGRRGCKADPVPRFETGKAALRLRLETGAVRVHLVETTADGRGQHVDLGPRPGQRSSRHDGLLHRASHRTGHADHASGSLDWSIKMPSSSWADTCGVLSSSHRVFSDTSRPVNQETG